jgi:hypothetical protein
VGATRVSSVHQRLVRMMRLGSHAAVVAIAVVLGVLARSAVNRLL